MSNYQPYFYVIGWPQLNWFYAGIEIANSKHKTANPDNLFRKQSGKRYTTSSKLVNRFTRWFGDPDILEVVRFPTAKEAADYEEYFLKAIGLKANKAMWLNRNVRGAILDDENNRRKISASWTPERREAQSKRLTGKPSGNSGKTASEETRKRLSKAIKGRKRTTASIQKMVANSRDRVLQKWGVIYKGHTYTIPELSTLTGVCAHTIRGRLKKGWSVEDTINMPVMKPPLITYQGKAYTLKDLAKLSPVGPETIRKRIASGMSVNDAVNTLGRTGSKRNSFNVDRSSLDELMPLVDDEATTNSRWLCDYVAPFITKHAG